MKGICVKPMENLLLFRNIVQIITIHLILALSVDSRSNYLLNSSKVIRDITLTNFGIILIQ